MVVTLSVCVTGPSIFCGLLISTDALPVLPLNPILDSTQSPSQPLVAECAGAGRDHRCIGRQAHDVGGVHGSGHPSGAHAPTHSSRCGQHHSFLIHYRSRCSHNTGCGVLCTLQQTVPGPHHLTIIAFLYSLQHVRPTGLVIRVSSLMTVLVAHTGFVALTGPAVVACICLDRHLYIWPSCLHQYQPAFMSFSTVLCSR